MQIDFHHTVTYVTARLAGFEHPHAEIVAYAAQYVDDATSHGPVYFNNKALYNRVSSAHKMLDVRNVQEVANHQVWLPFHFLPGNAGLPAGENHNGSFVEKIVCKPDSPVAQEMVRQVIVEKDKPYGLHRLGVAMHVYADTWAHQGFAGVLHDVNEVEDAGPQDEKSGFGPGLQRIIDDILDDAIPPLGHGRAKSFPDMPFLAWQYTNYAGEKVLRDNNELFCTAANKLCMAMQRYIAGDPDADVSGLKDEDSVAIKQLFANVHDENGEDRHRSWLAAIAEGLFSFGPQEFQYAARGKKSWKHHALDSSYDLPVHTYRPDFLKSNWKLFHDATQAHRFYVVHDLLPQYGICAA